MTNAASTAGDRVQLLVLVDAADGTSPAALIILISISLVQPAQSKKLSLHGSTESDGAARRS
jgi:hypothetical protein